MIEEVIVSALVLGGLYSLMALGFSLIHGVARITNLAHGAIYMLTAYLISTLYSSLGLGVAIVVSLILTVLVSIFIYRVLIGPLREKEVRVALVTLGVALIFQESVKLIWGSNIKSFPELAKGTTMLLGVKVTNQRLLVLIVAITLIICLWFFINRTKLGKAIRAVAQNLEVSQLVGIDVQKIFMLSMGISALLAGLTAVLFVPTSYIKPNSWTILFQTFPVIVLGGLGSLKGSVIAAFLIAFTEKIVQFYIQDGYLVPTVTFAVMLVIIFIKPSGLFGKSIK